MNRSINSLRSARSNCAFRLGSKYIARGSGRASARFDRRLAVERGRVTLQAVKCVRAAAAAPTDRCESATSRRDETKIYELLSREIFRGTLFTTPICVVFFLNRRF